ncbi:YecA family protein [Peribacillus frigoritolerans]|uniref:YecA family protein n=1 Tax=Peribacillus frigoritolerans TaxID=450367 RepID=UPI00203E33A1|nr:SEC-C metal-binding domain-containing protein [Peribacillus frigoritolerans]MCM3167916.1 SEC-C metal-binding domain-containing protein [Peribacillus frigoritolerans]
MEKNQITQYLKDFKGEELLPSILEELSKLKKDAVTKGDQKEAKNIWCLEQVYKIINHYVTAFKKLKNKDYFEAWNDLDRVDIELSFLRNNLDDDIYNLKFIEKNISQLQKLFPYKLFMSRETTVKKWSCSICNQVISLRKRCKHTVGDIYDGEMCCRVAGEIEFHGVALVTNPFDKYGVVFPKGKEYNYAILENLMKSWTNPYQEWELEITRELTEEYVGIGRNHPCICNSGKKYKNCCLKSGDNHHDHYKLVFINPDPSKLITMKKQMINSWKD